jgi:hypothetical protein
VIDVGLLFVGPSRPSERSRAANLLGGSLRAKASGSELAADVVDAIYDPSGRLLGGRAFPPLLSFVRSPNPIQVPADEGIASIIISDVRSR